jgi:ParB family transcriptional regulator, chromosome partitioning protein
MFIPDYPVANLRGADYNPRAIASDAIERLQESLRLIGVGKPIIVFGEVIVAGHQRTKALRLLGRETAPTFVLGGDLTPADEIRFNQLHNGVDFDMGDENARVPPSDALGFEELDGDLVTGNGQASGANVRAEICRLLNRYGNWGACIATQSGEVIHASQYALACMILRTPCRVYRIADAVADRARQLLSGEYGKFSYGHLPRATYVQSFAQPFRLREGAEVANKSNLYENYVLPGLKKTDRVLDFGCGQGDYVKTLDRAGFDIRGIEFFRRRGNAIDTAAVHRMIDKALADLRRAGGFDVVLADSVLNSVDTLQAEADVIDSLRALVRPGGRIYFSGRSRERYERQNKLKRFSVKNGEKAVVFMDDDGFSGVFHHGQWFYQKFCTEEQVEALVERHFPGVLAKITYKPDRWVVCVEQAGEIAQDVAEAALRREFDLCWPEGKSVARGAAAVEAYAATLTNRR